MADAGSQTSHASQMPSVGLRSYQAEAIAETWAWMRRNQGHPLIVLPTGSGKSMVNAALVVEAVREWGARVVCVSHTKEILAQNERAIRRIWPTAPIGVVCAGLGRKEVGYHITIGSVQSLISRIDKLGPVDLLVVDECHLIPRDGFGQYRTLIGHVVSRQKDARVIGLTATPYRLGSGYLHKGKDAIFAGISHEVMVGELVPEFLSPLVARHGSKVADMRGVAKRGGEYVEVEAVMAVDAIVSDAVRDFAARLDDRKKWLVFATSIEHADAIKAQLCGLGVAAESVHSKMASSRDHALKDFAEGRLRCLVNVNVLTTGFDQPDIDAIVLLRPTLSAGLHVQMLGRGMRKAPGKTDCVVLDYVGNVARHGPIGDVVVDGDKGEAATRECEGCQAIIAKGKIACPHCGHVKTKTCPKCKEQSRADAAVCLTCKHEFNAARKIDHDTKPSESDPMRRPEWLPVDDWRWSRHMKVGGTAPVLRVTYEVGLAEYTEWICLEHQGYARQKAREWWAACVGGEPPSGVDDALLLKQSAKIPKEIKVARDGKYYRVIGRKYAL